MYKVPHTLAFVGVCVMESKNSLTLYRLIVLYYYPLCQFLIYLQVYLPKRSVGRPAMSRPAAAGLETFVFCRPAWTRTTNGDFGDPSDNHFTTGLKIVKLLLILPKNT